MKKIVLVLCVIALTVCSAFAAGEYADVNALFGAWESEGYPDDVCSVYSVDGSTENLCILLTDDTPEREAEIRAMLRGASGVSFGSGAYSLNAMRSAQQEIVSQYMGAGLPVIGCGVGWGSVPFGESGKESRLIVDVLEESAEEYAKIFAEKYGDMVVVESRDGYVFATAEDSAASRLIPWMALAVFCVLACAAFFAAKAMRPAAQTVNGQTVRCGQPTISEVRQAVRESKQTPPDRVRNAIREKIEE